jgi:hypothetical protein
MELVSDAVGWLFHPFIGALAPLLVFMICLFALRPKPLLRASIATLFFSAAAFLFFEGGSFLWVLRDGLAVGMKISTGSEALGRFLPEFLPLASWAVGLCILGVTVSWWPLRRRGQGDSPLSDG